MRIGEGRRIDGGPGQDLLGERGEISHLFYRKAERMPLVDPSRAQ